MLKQIDRREGVTFRRYFAMPNGNTFEMVPCAETLLRYINPHDLARWNQGTLSEGSLVIDPFGRSSQWASFSNDLNPRVQADFHMESREFLRHLLELGYAGRADAVLLDPPYSPRQIAECYKGVGIKASTTDTQNSRLYTECKDLLTELLRPGGVALTWGWNSMGFGETRGFTLLEVVLICHGGAHNDTIITVERKPALPDVRDTLQGLAE